MALLKVLTGFALIVVVVGNPNIGLVQAPAPAGALRPSREEWEMTKMEEQDEKDAAAAKEAKMAAVNKVVSMLEDLQIEVLSDGEKEASTYNKFACFCKDNTAERNAAITKGQDDKASLTATINELASARDTLDEEIKSLLEALEEADKAMKAATAERKATLAIYQKNEADLSGALVSLEQAIEVMKASKSPTLLQMKSIMETVQTAADMADALGLGGASTQKAVASFLQQAPDVPMENYKFHSDGIIETLEQLLSDFRAEKNQVDEDEVKSVSAYDAFMQEKTDLVKAKKLELETAKKNREDKIADIAANTQELSTTSALLLDDQEFLAALTVTCTEKATTWDQRSQVRSDELSALTTAIGIIKGQVTAQTTAQTVRLNQQTLSVKLAKEVASNDQDMEAVEAAAEEADSSPSFLQRRSVNKASTPDVRNLILTLLRSKGQALKSTVLTALATKISADPFAKVKVLIQELITRLLQESANEANQKGWCDKATADATQKRDNAAEEIASLNAQMAELEARIDVLKEKLWELNTAIRNIEMQRQMAQMMRDSEKAENEQTVAEAQAGLEAVSQAIDILTKFYATVDKSQVADAGLTYAEAPAAAFVQISFATSKTTGGPVIEAPDAGFKNNEAYVGKQGGAEGIIGMMDVIKSDFERTITETEKAEAASQKDFLIYMTESGKSLAEKQEAAKEDQRQLDEAEEQFNSAKESMRSETDILKGALSELMELKPTCIDTGMSYAERVARREEEIEALNKAQCILGNYEKYGPDGVAEGC